MKRFQKAYIAEFVYGAIDGTITTFAVMAGALGASLSPSVVLVLGFANLFADGFSMAVSNYLSRKSAEDVSKAFFLTGKKRLPLYTASATFLSFVSIGVIPLLPFVFSDVSPMIENNAFFLSGCVTFLAFGLIGYIRGWVTEENRLKTMLETLLIGGISAIIAFTVGFVLEGLVS